MKDLPTKEWKELAEYAKMEGSELGEAVNLIVTLANGFPDYISAELDCALINEAKAMLHDFRTNYEITEETETKTVTYKELVYKGEQG